MFSGCQGLKKFVNFGDSEEPNSSKCLGLAVFGGYADGFGLDGFFVDWHAGNFEAETDSNFDKNFSMIFLTVFGKGIWESISKGLFFVEK